jgi:hypothetical protein
VMKLVVVVLPLLLLLLLLFCDSGAIIGVARTCCPSGGYV